MHNAKCFNAIAKMYFQMEDFNMNPDNRMLITSFFGLGYIYFNGTTKLITGWESDNYVVRIDHIEDIN